jgi:hypothetical protein
MKKVCFLLYNLEPGGSQINLLRFLDVKGNSINSTILIKNGCSGELYHSFIERKCSVIFIKCGYLNIKGWYQVYKLFKSSSFNSICDFTGNFGGIYLWLAKITNIHHRIAHFGASRNHFEINIFNSFYNKFVNKLVFLFSTKIISNSIAGLDFFFPYRFSNDSRFVTISNFIRKAL